MSKSLKQDALDYHSQGRPGKIEVVPWIDNLNITSSTFVYFLEVQVFKFT